jgi:serine/threonine protein kinase
MSTDPSTPENDPNLSGLGRALMGTNEGSKPSGPWVPPTAEELHQILPQYEIVKMLGRGGMGAVYMGRQTALDRPVAIKILSAQLEESDMGFTERFKNEARAMGKLNHPAVVKVFEFGQHESGLLYIVMEYVDGTDVARMIAKKGRLHTEHAMAIAAHVCDALAYAHERGIIHRDIKPANVMVGYDGVVKVADFGLAKVSVGGQTLGLTQSGMAMGTMHYMAPEALMLGSAVDHRADIYAVGVMLYQMLTGKIPHGMFKLPSTLVPGLDPRYDAIVSKAMMEDREARYQQISEMRVELDSILTQPVVKADPARPEQAVALTTGARPQRSVGQPFRPPQPRAEPASSATPPAPRSLAWLWVTLLVVSVFGALAWFVLPGGRQEMAQSKTENPAAAAAKAGATSQGTPPASKTQSSPPAAAKAPTPLIVPPGYDKDAARQIAEWVFAGGGEVLVELVKDRKGVRCATPAEIPQEESVLVWINQGLSFHKTQTTPFPSHLLAGVPTLRGFEIRQAKPLQKADMEAVMRLPDLKKISIGNMTLTLEAFQALKPSDKIDHIRLGRVVDSKDADGVWRHLIGRYPNLTFLETQEFLKAKTLAEVIPAFPKLVDFRAYMEFTPQVAEQLARLKSLRILQIKGLGLDHPAVPSAAFLPLRHLESLTLINAAPLKSVLGVVSEMTALKELGLNGLGMARADLAALRVLGRLEILSLSANPGLDDGAVDSLKGFTSLKELRLDRTKVSDQGLALLRAALPGCKITPGAPEVAKSPAAASAPASQTEQWIIPFSGENYLFRGRQTRGPVSDEFYYVEADETFGIMRWQFQDARLSAAASPTIVSAQLRFHTPDDHIAGTRETMEVRLSGQRIGSRVGAERNRWIEIDLDADVLGQNRAGIELELHCGKDAVVVHNKRSAFLAHLVLNVDAKEAAAVQAPSAPSAATPIWTDTKGRSLQAKFVRLEAGNVELDIAGKITPVPLTTLSPASQALALKLGENPAPAVSSQLPPSYASRCTAEARMDRIRQNGGSAEIEQAVTKSLAWLKTQQNPDGSWGRVNKAGYTGFALQCFFARCETTDSAEHGDAIVKALMYLIEVSRRNPHGLITEKWEPKTSAGAYEHAIATTALGEACILAKGGPNLLPGLREAFTAAVQAIIDNQNKRGSWTYGGDVIVYKNDSTGEDLSLSNWHFQALRVARDSGLKLADLDLCISQAVDYIVSKQTKDGGFGGIRRDAHYNQWYLSGGAIVGLQTLTAGDKNAEIRQGVKFLRDFITAEPLNWGVNCNLYSWRHYTDAFFLVGGDDWRFYSAQLVPQILSSQQPDGSFMKGTADWPASGAVDAIYRQCLSTLQLEVFYRLAPRL